MKNFYRDTLQQLPNLSLNLFSTFLKLYLSVKVGMHSTDRVDKGHRERTPDFDICGPPALIYFEPLLSLLLLHYPYGTKPTKIMSHDRLVLSDNAYYIMNTEYASKAPLSH